MPRAEETKKWYGCLSCCFQGETTSSICLAEDSDKRYYIGLMKKKAVKYSVEIYAYCVMSNHIHMIVKSDLKILSAYMKELNFDYAIYHNVQEWKMWTCLSGPLL